MAFLALSFLRTHVDVIVMSYIAHLAHGHTHKLQAKVLSKFVL